MRYETHKKYFKNLSLLVSLFGLVSSRVKWKWGKISRSGDILTTQEPKSQQRDWDVTVCVCYRTKKRLVTKPDLPNQNSYNTLYRIKVMELNIYLVLYHNQFQILNRSHF